MARIIRFAFAIVSSILSPGKVARSGPTGVNAGGKVHQFPGAKIHQRSWQEGPVTWGLFSRHQAWVGLSAGGRPIGKYRQWAMEFSTSGLPTVRRQTGIRAAYGISAAAYVPSLCRRYPSSYPTKTFSHLDQFLSMAFAPLTFRESPGAMSRSLLR